MGFASLLRTSPRLNCLKIHPARPNPRLPVHHNTRLFSSAIQRGGHIHRNTAFRVTPSLRNYWWSSSADTPPAPTPSPASILPEQSTPSASTGQLPAETAASVEPSSAPAVSSESTTQTNAVADQADLPTSGLDAVVSDSPITSIPDLLPPPLQYGDFADLGLSGWMPPGIAAWSFETLQVTTGMPWFYAIVIGTILWRLTVVVPSLRSARSTAIMRSNPGIAKARANLEAAKAKGSSLQVTTAVQKLQKSYKDAGVSIPGTMLMSLVQIPVTIGVFVAIRRMCNLPVEQLKHSGVSFMPDLTLVPGTEAFDPYYILPILSVLAVNYQLKLSLRDMDPEPPTSMHVMNCFRVVSPLMLAFTSFFPAGLLLSIMTGIVCTGAQSLLLRLPRVRRKLELPRLPNRNLAPPSVLDSLKYMAKKAREVYSSESSKQVATKARSKSS